jgi:L-asparagine transporter-like permease
VFTFCVGAYYADTSNWSSWEKFAPYGFKGVITAAGSCFYAFVGFDVVGTAGEEALNPKTAIPRAFIATIVVSFLSYFGVSTVLTLMQPYNQLNRFAPLAEAFAQRGFVAAKYVIAVGAVFATLGCLLSIAFAAPRIIHAMASDGLLFRWLDSINSKTHVPVRALVCSTTFIGVLTVILDLEQLVEMLSIGTLIAYTLVAVSVLLTRYQCGVESVYDDTETQEEDTNKAIEWMKSLCCKAKVRESRKYGVEYTELTTSDNSYETLPQDSENKDEPTETSSFRASVATFILSVALIVLCIVLSSAHDDLVLLKAWAILVTCICAVIILAAIVFLYKQPMNSATFPFTVPFVPFLPILTLFVNLLLIVNLNHWTYIRFSVWMVLGRSLPCDDFYPSPGYILRALIRLLCFFLLLMYDGVS